jgi:hypothetical protein
MSRNDEMPSTRESLRETASLTNTARSKKTGPLGGGFSRTILTVGTFAFVWLLCAAFVFTPAQAQVTGTATQPTTPSLPAAWSGWREVPPRNGFTLAAPGATDYRGNLYVFVRGTDSRIYQNRLTGSSWSGWREVPGNGLTPDALTATVYRDKLYVFVRGTDNRIYQNRLTGSSWSGWSQVPGNGLTPSGPEATVYQGALYVFVRGTDNRIYLNKLPCFPQEVC